jgi:hypothetical protein
MKLRNASIAGVVTLLGVTGSRRMPPNSRLLWIIRTLALSPATTISRKAIASMEAEQPWTSISPSTSASKRTSRAMGVTPGPTQSLSTPPLPGTQPLAHAGTLHREGSSQLAYLPIWSADWNSCGETPALRPLADRESALQFSRGTSPQLRRLAPIRRRTALFALAFGDGLDIPTNHIGTIAFRPAEVDYFWTRFNLQTPRANRFAGPEQSKQFPAQGRPSYLTSDSISKRVCAVVK